MSDDKKKSSKKLNTRKIYLLVFGCILTLFLVFYTLLIYVLPNIYFTISPSISLKHMAQIGDSFNVLTSLFTGLAFAGLLVSIFIQREELKLQQKELRKTKKEFTRMNKLQITQQFKNDIQRDISYIKNCIDNFEVILDTKEMMTLCNDLNVNTLGTSFYKYIVDLTLLSYIMNDNIYIYIKRYNKEKRIRYAKEELNKILSYNGFTSIINNMRIIHREINKLYGQSPMEMDIIAIYNKTIEFIAVLFENDDLIGYLNEKNKTFIIKNAIDKMFETKEQEAN